MPRQVTVTDDFFDRLEILLPAERVGEGVPSRTDFLMYELPAIIDQLADDLEVVTSPASPGSTLRVYVSAGIMVDFLAVYARLVNDVVEVVWLSIDQGGR